jgi:hypothetical protein
MDGCTCVLILNVCICMYVCLCLWVYAFVALTWEARGGCAAGNVVPAPKDSQLWLWEVGTGAFPPKKPQRKKEKGGWGGGDNLFVLSPVFLSVGGGCGMEKDEDFEGPRASRLW